MEQVRRDGGDRRPPRRGSRTGGSEDSTGLETKIYGRKRLVFSRQEICDDLLKSLPKLHAALKSSPPTNERLWRRTSSEHASVHTFEMVGMPPDSGKDGDETEVQYAVAASIQLKCHLNEVLNVLTSQNSTDFTATMEALHGQRFEEGEVLYHERCRLKSDGIEGNTGNGGLEDKAQVLLGVQMASLRPSSLRLLPNSMCYPDQRSAQRLCFESLTHRYPDVNRAVHVMKTLPRRIHDQIVPQDCCSALCEDVDHLGIAFDIESMPVPDTEASDERQITRVFAHAYVATTASDSSDHNSSALETYRGRLRTQMTPENWQHTRPCIVNPEAKQILEFLTLQLAEFERVIKRRRLGFQSLIHFPPSVSKGESEPPLPCVCISCVKRFTLFRREFYCQVCGHLVCGDCSQLYETEARAGEVRKNRVCVQCINRVDSCVFANEDQVAALGPTVVPVDRASVWSEIFGDDESDDDEDDERDDSQTSFMRSDTISFSTEVCLPPQRLSSDSGQRSEGLVQLGKILNKAKQRYRATAEPRPQRKVKFSLPSTGISSVSPASDTVMDRVQAQLINYINRTLRDGQQKFSFGKLETASLTRNYRYAFDASKTKYEGHPLPPIPTPPQETLRLRHIRASGILEPEYDHSALDLLAQVAAKLLKCPIGFISLVDDAIFHSVGTYPPRNFGLQAPRTESMCSHTVYADKPLVIKNAQCDVRFAQMLVVRDHGIRFYAGFPIRAPDNSIVASLCVSDRVPHSNISAADYATMQTLATVAAQLVSPSNRVLSIPIQPRILADPSDKVQQKLHTRDRSKQTRKPQNSRITKIEWR